MSTTPQHRSGRGTSSHALAYSAAGLGGVGLIIAFLFALPAITEGSGAMAMGTDMAWGLPVVGYAYFALASMGLSLAATYGALFGGGGWERLAPRLYALALALSLGGIAVLFLELGSPITMLWAIPTGMQFKAPIVWMGLFWGLFILLVTTLLLRSYRTGNDRAYRGLAIAIALVALGAIFTQGLAYGMFPFRPLWYGIGTPLYYLAGALTAGLSLALLVARGLQRYRSAGASDEQAELVERQMPLALLAALAIYAAVTVAKMVGGLWSPTSGAQEVYQSLITDPLYMGGEITLGIVLPLLLLALPAWRARGWVQVTAAVLIFIGLFIARYTFTIGGQLVPMFKGSWIPGFVEYMPNSVEWGIVATGLFLALLVYGIGERLLAGRPMETAHAR